MSTFTDTTAQQQILNRLKRAEGQMRGLQRMIEAGEPCNAVAAQMSAVRKALDSTAVQMAMCYLKQELRPEGAGATGGAGRLDTVVAEVQDLLNKVR
jgi:CsoR family transcriptional regulator, copper-sensing transcriptional repressor